jgi:hypothetical protein
MLLKRLVRIIEENSHDIAKGWLREIREGLTTKSFSQITDDVLPAGIYWRSPLFLEERFQVKIVLSKLIFRKT